MSVVRGQQRSARTERSDGAIGSTGFRNNCPWAVGWRATFGFGSRKGSKKPEAPREGGGSVGESGGIDIAS